MSISTNAIDPGLLGLLNKESPGAGTRGSGELQDRFMTLLIAQLENQDPLNPMENAEMTSQLAQINTAGGISDLNDTLGRITDQIDSGRTLEAAELIDKGVMVPGEQVLVGGEGTVTPFGLELEAPADQVEVTISDGSGREIRSMDLGGMGAGAHTFVWDGKANDGAAVPDGAYRISVEASAGGEQRSVQRLQYAVVNGVNASAGRPLLDLGGVAEPVGLEVIRKIL